jgi:MYXO-CTERM domain-containing protein
MGNSSDESDRTGTHGADLAALIGATIAVLFTVTNTPGAWGPQSTIIGLLLLVVLLAFFSRRRPPAEQRGRLVEQHRENRELIFIGFTLSVVVACVAAIASAQAVQVIWFSNNHSSFECRSVAVEQAASAVHDLSDSLSDAKLLSQLVDKTLKHGYPSGPHKVSGPTEEDQALRIAFYDEYDNDDGACLAGYTTNSLRWIAVPSFLLTLAWWNWKYTKTWRSGST